MVDVVLPTRAALGECPVWDGRVGRLYWIDIDGRRLHCTDPASGTDEICELPGRPGSMVLTADIDRFLVAMEHSIVEVVWSAGTTLGSVTELLVLEADNAVTRMNDGRCDAAGRFWVGSMEDPAGSRTFAGSLFRVDGVRDANQNKTDETIHDSAAVALGADTMRHDVGIANGLAFSPDGTTMYWADTNHATVWAYDYDLAAGTQSNERVFLDFAELPGLPDGACVDADGCYWVACVTGSAVVRATPDGMVDRIIDLPVELPTMPAFGGPNLDALYITSIDAGDELGGALLSLDAATIGGVVGLPEPHFTE